VTRGLPSYARPPVQRVRIRQAARTKAAACALGANHGRSQRVILLRSGAPTAGSACMSAVPPGRGGNAQIVLIYAPQRIRTKVAPAAPVRRRWVVTRPASSTSSCAWAFELAGHALAAGCALPGVRLAHLRDLQEGAVLDPAENRLETGTGQAGRGESRDQAAPVPAHPRPGTMAGRRGTRAPGLLRRARQQRCGERLPHPGDTALAHGAAAPQPANPDQLGQDEPHRDPVDTPDPHRAPIPASALRRHAPKVGAQCGNSARWDLCGGPPARAMALL
jgi:hypothetical protein